MTLDETSHKRAVWQHAHAALAGGLQRGANQRRTQPLTFEPVVDLGVGEVEVVADAVILREARELAVHGHLEPPALGVVA